MVDISQEVNAEGTPLFSPPVALPQKSPLRLVAIDKLMSGEEILPKNFIIVFSPTWNLDEIRYEQKLYRKLLPVIGVCGKVVLLHSNYQDTEVEMFLVKQRKLNG